MKRTEDVLRTLANDIGPRPTGTAASEAANTYLAKIARELGFAVTELHFDCRRWEYGPSSVATAEGRSPVYPGPFSEPLCGRFPVALVKNVDELRGREMAGALLLIRGELAKEPLMPRNFPFYYPDKHRQILDLLADKRPAGVLALTGKHPLCGLSPFPLFEDGNLGIPNAYAHDAEGSFARAEAIELDLKSASLPSEGRQLVFSRSGSSERRVILAAHLDTKYETPGALDNAAGVATAVSVMERLRDVELPFDLDVVPLNGEEYFGVSGQLAYLAHRRPTAETTQLMINLDALGHRESKSAFSFYNTDADALLAHALVEDPPSMVKGEQWFFGDHAVFAFRDIATVAVTSSNLMERVVSLTHTAADSFEKVDIELLDETAAVVARLVIGD